MPPKRKSVYSSKSKKKKPSSSAYVDKRTFGDCLREQLKLTMELTEYMKNGSTPLNAYLQASVIEGVDPEVRGVDVVFNDRVFTHSKYNLTDGTHKEEITAWATENKFGLVGTHEFLSFTV